MFTIRAFAALPNLADNRPGMTALFGELSPKAQAYSRTRMTFTRTDCPDGSLEVYSCRNDLGNEVSLASTASEKPLQVIQFVYNKYVAEQIPNNAQKAAFITTLTSNITGISNVSIGSMLPGENSLKWMPDYIVFDYSVGTSTYTMKLWFADSAFNEYDLFELFVVGPVSTVSQLDGAYATVKAAVDARSVASVFSEVSNIFSGHPTDEVMTYMVQWSDPADRSKTIDMTFTLVGYGPKARDEDNIRAAIRSWLSTQTNVNWSNYFIGLYTTNEFTVVPTWGALAPLGTTVDTGVHSAIALVNNLRSDTSTRLPAEYESLANLTSYLSQNLQLISTSYRSVFATIIGHPANQDGKFKFSDVFGDYINVATTSPDYGRMSANTQQFVSKLNQALDLARGFEVGDALPSGYTGYYSGGRHFIAFTHLPYRYLVLARTSYASEGNV